VKSELLIGEKPAAVQSCEAKLSQYRADNRQASRKYFQITGKGAHGKLGMPDAL